MRVRAEPAESVRTISSSDAGKRQRALENVLRTPQKYSASFVRRALVAVAGSPNADLLALATRILTDSKLDSTTRAVAAMTVGRIGRDFPGVFPSGEGEPPSHDPLPTFSKRALEDCVARESELTVRRACAEAVGLAGLTDTVSTLESIVATHRDPFLVYAAARSLGRFSGVNHVTREIADRVAKELLP